MHRPITVLAAVALLQIASPDARAMEPELRLDLNGVEKVFTRAQLLAHPRARTLHVPFDVSYRRPMTYQAVSVAALFQGHPVDKSASVRFVATDGFSASIDPARLLNTSPSGAIAYVAVEPKEKPWPPLLAGGKTSAGPFYVVWDQPERSRISRSVPGSARRSGPSIWRGSSSKSRCMYASRRCFPSLALPRITR
jgi:hypothetical protein